MAVLLLMMAGIAAADAVPRDPTRPPGVSAGGSPAAALVLSATQVSDERRSAVINGQRVAEGDTVAGATVVRIERGRVQLRRGGTNIQLVLPGQQVRVPTAEAAIDD